MPFIVRQELGYQDRDQYRILTLFEPGKKWSRWTPQEQWNQKLLITHGGGCGGDYDTSSARLDDYSGTIPPTPGYTQSYVTALGRGLRGRMRPRSTTTATTATSWSRPSRC